MKFNLKIYNPGRVHFQMQIVMKFKKIKIKNLIKLILLFDFLKYMEIEQKKLLNLRKCYQIH